MSGLFYEIPTIEILEGCEQKTECTYYSIPTNAPTSGYKATIVEESDKIPTFWGNLDKYESVENYILPRNNKANIIYNKGITEWGMAVYQTSGSIGNCPQSLKIEKI